MSSFGGIPVRDEGRVPRPNFCGGAVRYDENGHRYRKQCQNDAVADEALCKSCKIVESEERSKDLCRIKSQKQSEPVASRGRRWE